MSTAAAPIEIGHVALVVNDLDALSDFYTRALGLTLLSRDGPVRRLGAADRPLLELRGDPAARRAPPGEAGLFHTAFLMPDRRALARWLGHAADTGVRLQGASDHLVSEALYLADPEGNGIEVYVDRPRKDWQLTESGVKMATAPLDLNDLLRAADAPWTGAPAEMAVGHVHLQVGDLPAARAFYGDLLGLPVMATYPGATFHGSGGYHHHIATNIWNSRGAGPRRFPATGLAELVLTVEAASRAAILARGGASAMADPWGTPVTLAEGARA